MPVLRGSPRPWISCDFDQLLTCDNLPEVVQSDCRDAYPYRGFKARPLDSGPLIRYWSAGVVRSVLV